MKEMPLKHLFRLVPAWRYRSHMLGGGMFKLDRQFWIVHDQFMALGYGYFLDGVFGGQPCAWHSGRIVRKPIPEKCLEKTLHAVFEEYTRRGISCMLNFSAPDVDTKMLPDKRSNLLLRILAEHNASAENPHGVIVSSDCLLEYVRDKHPGLRITASVIKTAFAHPEQKEGPDWYNGLAERFDMVVVRSDRNLSLSYLAQLEPKEKMEIILNSECVVKCPMRVQHYQLMQDISRGNMSAAPAFAGLMERCREQKKEKPNICLTDAQVESIFGLGFRHFKLAGREMDWTSWVKLNSRFLVDQDIILKSFQLD